MWPCPTTRFAGHPKAAARRHNALVDPEALRVAWLVVTGRESIELT